MKLHRFIGDYFTNDGQKLANGQEIELKNPQIVKQIRGVLRLEKGEKIILSDGQGVDAEVIIGSIYKDKIYCIIDNIKKGKEEKKKVSLYLAILKKENFELAVQKSVECGVSEIIPVITDRTIKTGLNEERLKKIILEASEQSGRSFVPILSPTLNFKDAIENGKSKKEKFFFDLTGDAYISSIDKKSTENKETSDIGIFIGPEGGFTQSEIDTAKNSNYKIVSLGDFTLRAETAAIIATYRASKGV